jgi:NAD(P)-dependent dehydrogenase (short-subunit alcohol dehydrogenase family)
VTRDDQWKRVIDAIVEKHGKIDILVNNAAICLYEPILETTEAMWDKVLDIDLKSVFFGMREVLPHMIRRKAGFDRQPGVDLGSRGGAKRPRLSGGEGCNPERQQECRLHAWAGRHPLQLSASRLYRDANEQGSGAGH